jgi:hypothetical protein
LISPGPWSLRPNCTQFVGLFPPFLPSLFFFGNEPSSRSSL